jgi:Na+/H+ antiporter NhaD/arsenite permease-like protein
LPIDPSATLLGGVRLLSVAPGFDVSIYLSLALLFGIAAQFRAMDGYAFIRKVIFSLEPRFGVTYAVVIVTSLFSPFILNDVVILILTPFIVRYCKQVGVDAAPLIVSAVTFTNISGSLTPFGNPQNILLWESSGISATAFLTGTWLPLSISAILSVASIHFLRSVPVAKHEMQIPPAPSTPGWYLLLVGAIIFGSDFLKVSSTLALAIGFLAGFPFTFRALPLFAKEFDLRSLVILYILITSVTLASSLIADSVGPYAVEAASGGQPFSAIFVGVLSNIISNVPATQLILSLAHVAPSVAPKIAVEAGLAGNLDPIASFADILALLLVRRAGLPLRRIVLLQLLVGTISFLPALL